MTTTNKAKNTSKTKENSQANSLLNDTQNVQATAEQVQAETVKIATNTVDAKKSDNAQAEKNQAIEDNVQNENTDNINNETESTIADEVQSNNAENTSNGKNKAKNKGKKSIADETKKTTEGSSNNDNSSKNNSEDKVQGNAAEDEISTAQNSQSDSEISDNDLIVLKDVCKAYDGQNVVDNVNLSIKKGEFVTFLGPSGCGKTTTLRMIAGFEKPTSGEILLDGKSVLDIPPHLRPVNTVFQRYALFPHLNVFDNIAFGLKMKRKELCTDVKGFFARRKAIKNLISEKVKKALKIVGLTDYEYRNVTSLSGGQQQRVAIARAIVNEPQVLLLDEPLGALDLKMRQEMQLELKNMHRRLGITFVYVTHDQEEALTMSDRIVIMKNGIIHQVGTPIDIYNEPTNAFVADFIGESNIINGIMIKDKLVRFAGAEFVCVDGGFEKNQAIDVVIRPEDIYLMDEEKGQIKGEVISSLFKGVHYEMSVIANKVEFLIHSTTEWKAGEKVSLYIRPDDIHIMKKEKNSNVITAKVLNESEIEFADGVFNYDKATFEKAGFAEADYLKEEVRISVDFDKIDLTDYEDSAPIAGNIVSSIFKGDKYQYVVKSDNGFDFFVDTEDEYDSNDRVGITIRPEDIKLIKIGARK